MIKIKMIAVNNINFEHNINYELMKLQSEGCEILDIYFDLDTANSIVIIIYKDNGGELSIYPHPKLERNRSKMTNEEIIQALKDMWEKSVEELEPKSRMLFDVIMIIADERDELREKVKLLNKQNEELYEKYCKILKENEEWFRARTYIEKIMED